MPCRGAPSGTVSQPPRAAQPIACSSPGPSASASARGANRTTAARTTATSSTSPIHSTLACPRSPRMTGDRTSARRTGGYAGAKSALQRNDDALGGAGLRRLDHLKRGDAGVEWDRWRLTAARPNRPLHPLVELDVASRLCLDRLRVLLGAEQSPRLARLLAEAGIAGTRAGSKRLSPARRDPTSRTRLSSRARAGAVQAARRAWSRRDGSARRRNARARGRRRRPPPRPDRTLLTSAYTERAGPSSSST